jgi:hypothetical protein
MSATMMIRATALFLLAMNIGMPEVAAQDARPKGSEWYVGAALLGQVYQAADAPSPETVAFAATLSGITPGITAMAGLALNRRIEIGVEATWASLTGPATERRSGVFTLDDVNEIYGHRDVRLSFVSRWRSSQTGRSRTVSLEPLVGVTLALSRESLHDRMQTTTHFGGKDYHVTGTTTALIADVESTSAAPGVVGGLDVRWTVTPRWSFLGMFRVVYIARDDYQALPWGESGFESHPVPVGVGRLLVEAGGGVRWGRHR